MNGPAHHAAAHRPLTRSHHVGMIGPKERKNSEHSGTRAVISGFFMPDVSMSGGRQGYKTRKGKTACQLCLVSYPPDTYGQARKNVPRGGSLAQETFQ